MRTHTAEDIEADLDMLYRYEFEGLTTYALASKVGLSQSQVSRRLQRARRYRDDRRLAEQQRRVIQGHLERGDPLDAAKHVELIDAAEGRPVRGDWYDLESGYCSVEGNRKIAVGSRNGASALDPGSGQGCPEQRLEGQRLTLRWLESGSKRVDQDQEAKSDRSDVNDTDRSRGVVYVQSG